MDESNAIQAAEAVDSVQMYIKDRVEQYAGWYDRKSGPLKQRYLNIKAITVLSGTLVPVLVNASFPYASYFATVLSLVVVILVGWDSVFQYGKQWKNYRSTEQFLRQEIILFQNQVGMYAEMDEKTAFRVFVERIENAIAQENAVTLDTLSRDLTAGKAESAKT